MAYPLPETAMRPPTPPPPTPVLPPIVLLLHVSSSSSSSSGAAGAAAAAAAAAWGPLVSTPCGPRPQMCVREAPPGAVLGEAGLVHADGRLETVDTPRACHAFMETYLAASAAVPDGWVASAGVYRMDPTSTVHSFTARFTVPPAPANPRRPETLYYFIGLEDRSQGKLTTIHQPVLTWGDQTEGGQFDNQWHLWSWTCCPKNLTWHSADIAGFRPGDTIYGSIEKTSEDTWRVDGAWRQGDGQWRNTTLTSRVGGYNYNYADVTLEVYNVTACDQMSAGRSVFSDIALTLDDGRRWVPPTWYVSGLDTSCQTSARVVNASQIELRSGVVAETLL